MFKMSQKNREINKFCLTQNLCSVKINCSKCNQVVWFFERQIWLVARAGSAHFHLVAASWCPPPLPTTQLAYPLPFNTAFGLGTAQHCLTFIALSWAFFIASYGGNALFYYEKTWDFCRSFGGSMPVLVIWWIAFIVMMWNSITKDHID